MSTGGLVTIIPCLSDFSGTMQIAGINQEWIERLSARDAETHPPEEIWGSNDPGLVSYWNDRSFFTAREGYIVYASILDAEISKCVLNEMANEAGVKTYLHSWGTMPVMDGNKAAGVVFESKSGRQPDFKLLRERLIAQNVPLPGAYPEKYKKKKKRKANVFQPPFFPPQFKILV